MIAKIPTDKVILKKWLKAGYVYQNELFPTDVRPPQGGIISPVAANMTLDGLDATLRPCLYTSRTKPTIYYEQFLGSTMRM
jgi:retron-type reverse transcriptase